MDSRQRHSLLGAAAFATGALCVVWIGGAIGAAGFKAVFWLVCGTWPETAVQALVPEAALRFVVELPQDSFSGLLLGGFLRLDILTCILLGPPLLLGPCLAVLVSASSAGEAWRLAVKPFAPAGRRAPPPVMHPALRRRGFPIVPTAADSTTNGPHERRSRTSP